ncbi:MAG: preprotein translocase subunit SecG [Psychrilyobacter sp.]|uniref:preprotein translocase subunit SecG n=1 Tax=Psychrilyobacter sp. TaxID=2586924 RepID=UPI003C7585DB
MATFLTVILFILAISLMVLVIMQPDRSKGMSGGIGTGATNSIFGVHDDGGPLAKATEFVAAGFLIVALLLYLVS